VANSSPTSCGPRPGDQAINNEIPGDTSKAARAAGDSVGFHNMARVRAYILTHSWPRGEQAVAIRCDKVIIQKFQPAGCLGRS